MKRGILGQGTRHVQSRGARVVVRVSGGGCTLLAMTPRLAALALTLALVSSAERGLAYTFGGRFGAPCHETMSWDALRTLRSDMALGDPLARLPEDESFIADLTFTTPPDMRDLGGVTLAIGVRDNDLKGLSGLDTVHLPVVHGDVGAQREHCLRHPEQDGAEGSEAALRDCREFILERFTQALSGLDADGRVDDARRMSLPVYLAYRGAVELSLPIFYVRMGQALHTLQDGFTHTFRSPDHRRVTVVLNWVDALDDFDEARDGPSHMHDLDLCDDADELRRERHRRATEASVELLRAGLDPKLDVSA
ncbi:MAG: hypothetical protein EXR75_00550, partial [Myxococcales bacterium]|nr:hypothetical protein [Myxococcales bacterium]